MSAVATLPLTALRFLVTVQAGPDQGQVFQLLPPQISIGRGADNSIPLSDGHCSRQHVVIDITDSGVLLRNVSGKQPVYVNDLLTTEALLQNGDIIRLGHSELYFVIEALEDLFSPPQADLVPITANNGELYPHPLATPEALQHHPNAHSLNAYAQPQHSTQEHHFTQQAPPFAPPPPPPVQTKKENKTAFYAVVLVIVAVIAYVALSENKKSAHSRATVNTDEKVLETVEALDKKVTELEKSQTYANEGERLRIEESKRYFLEGFRDFQKGQYRRAIQSFQAARALDPKNLLIYRYEMLATKSLDETAEFHLKQGAQYRDKNMYSRCSAAMAKVITILDNDKNPKSQEAKLVKKECDLLNSGGR